MDINLNSKQPIFEQIADKIKKYIDHGILKKDEKLPSVRELGLSLGINPNTVNRAYLLLEKEGYIYSLNKKGSYVKDKQSDKDKLKEELRITLNNSLKTFSKEEIINLVNGLKEDK